MKHQDHWSISIVNDPSKKKFRAEHALLFFGVALFPLYVFPSGGVQPSHLMLAAFFSLTLIERGIPNSSCFLMFIAFIVYAFITESYYILWGSAISHLVNVIYLFYNFLLAAAIYCFYQRFSPISLFIATFFSALIVSGYAVAHIFFGWDEVRFTGPFNNPNQLGYFSVVLISLTYLFNRLGVAPYYITIFLSGTAIFFSIMSLSKAAMIPVVLSAFLVLSPVSNARGMKLAWAILVPAALTIAFLFYQQGFFDEYRAVRRLSGMFDENDSSLDARGYLAFFDASSLQLIFGMGTDYARNVLGGKEVHSTLASVFTYYGFIGFLLFSSMLFIWAVAIWSRFGGVALICIAGPSMAYGLTHNGIRFSIFWILFGASLAMARKAQRYRMSGEG